MPVIEERVQYKKAEEGLSANSLEKDPRWALVQRIMASKTFGKAYRLSKFLAYVGERQLLNRTDEITEQQVGVHVFGRSSSYNPGEDNIVRTSARLLRQRLDQYFYEEGLCEPLRITIPRGGYVPVFEERHFTAGPVAYKAFPIPTALHASEAPPLPVAPARSRLRGRALSVGLAALAVAAILAVVILLSAERVPASERFWSALFRPDQRTLFVPGDSGLVILENLSHHESDLATYSSGQYLDWAAKTTETTADRAKNLGLRRYTAVSDVQLAARLSAADPSREAPLQIRYARDLTPEDLKTGNVILSGDPQGNPWVELFDEALNFRFTMDSTSAMHIVRNSSPRPGEDAEYRSFGSDPQHRAYALIAYTRNLSGTGHVMLIEGTTMAGIDAASDLLFSSSGFSAAIQPALQPDGSFSNFEVLIETQNLAARSSGFKIIATRFQIPSGTFHANTQ